jgi:hypothetical protein
MGWKFRGSILGMINKFLFSTNIQTGSGDHQVPVQLFHGVFPRTKVAEA